jgi:glucosylceramidase
MAFPLIINNVEGNIKGIAYQWDGKHSIAQTAESFPHIPTIQSENECGDGNNTWQYMKYIFGLVHHYLKHGVRAYCYWNMILPTKNGISTWGWAQNCLVSTSQPHDTPTINCDGASPTQLNKSGIEELPIDYDTVYNHEYFLFKHLSKFVGAGSTFLDASGDFASMSVSFKNAEGQIVTIIKNPLDTDREIVIDTTSRLYKLTLKADSITTFLSGSS